MQYKLDLAFLGKNAQCSSCRKKFVMERISETMTLAPEPEHALFESQEIPSVAPISSNEHKAQLLKPSQEITRLQSDPTDRPEKPAQAASIQTESVSMVPEGDTSSFHTGIWNVGELILGIYEVRELAPGIPYAQGGVGIVQRIYHHEWDMELAVKSPKPGVLYSETGVANYERECQTWIELGLHPNIVACYLVRRIGSIPRIFAEFIPDGSLRDWIIDCRIYDGGPEVSLLRVIDIAIQFAWGLDYAHKLGLLHLDVKPANVMMSSGIPKVTDFGLAQATAAGLKRAESLSTGSKRDDNSIESGMESGIHGVSAQKWEGMTPGYCSPEQYQAFLLHQRGEQNSKLKIMRQSDIWSWAISVLAMFHGRAPCKKGGQTASKVFELFLETTPSHDRPKMPPGLVEILRHCFKENPKSRPVSMADVADRLIEVYKSESGGPYPRKRPATTNWNAESINNRAASMLDLNKPLEAEKLFNDAQKMQPWQPEVSYNQTLMYWRNADITDSEAISRMETLVRTRNEAASFYALGLIQRERGNISSAIIAFENAWEKDERPEIRRALTGIGKIADRSVRCTERFSTQGINGPVAYMDKKEKILLVATGADSFVVFDTKLSRKTMNMKRSDQSGSSSEMKALNKKTIAKALSNPNFGKHKPGDRVAISEDFRWELLQGDSPDCLVLKHASKSDKATKLTAVSWGGIQTEGISIFDPTEQVKDSRIPEPIDVSRTVPTEFTIRLVADDLNVKIIDPISNTLVGSLVGHESTIQSLSLGGRNGRWIASAGKDRSIRIWEIPSCRCVRTLGAQEGTVDAVYLSRSGSVLLAIIGGNSLRVWDVSLLCRSFNKLRAPVMLCQISSSEELSRQQNEMALYKEDLETALRSKNYSYVIQMLDKMQELPGWEITKKEIPWEELVRHCVKEKPSDVVCTHTFVGHEDKVSAVALSLDGNLAVSTGRDQTIRIWNTKTGKCAWVMEGHQDWIRDIALSLDGRYVISGSWDMTVRIWNTGTGKCARILNDKIRSISKVAFHPLGRIAAVATAAGSIGLWDIPEERMIGNWSAHMGEINSLAFSRDGRYITTAGDDATVKIWDTNTQRQLRSFTRGRIPITAVCLLTGFQTVFSAMKDGMFEIRNLNDEKNPLVVSGHYAEILALSCIVDNRFMLTASRDQTVKIWKIADGSLLKTVSGHSGAVTGIATDFSGSKILTSSDDGTVRFWELYWDYVWPGNSEWDSSAEPIIQTLLSLYCPDPAGEQPPVLEEQGIRRIILEMEYRGFGWITPEGMRNAIKKLQANWKKRDLTPH